MYVGYLYFHKVRGLLAFWIGALLIAFTLLSNKYTIIILFIFLVILIIRYLVFKFKPLSIVASEQEVTSPQFIKQNGLVNNVHLFMFINGKMYKFNMELATFILI